MNLSKNQKIILISFAVLFIIMVIIGIYFAALQSQMGKVSITVAPSDSTVKLDGKQISGSGLTYVNEGAHEIEISRLAFITKKVSFDIKKGEEKTFNLYILPDGSPAALQWLKDHPDEANLIDGSIGKEYTEKANQVHEDNPILSILPIIDGNFRISQGVSQKGGEFAIYIQAADQEARDAALDAIRQSGFDPSLYEIIYENPAQQ